MLLEVEVADQMILDQTLLRAQLTRPLVEAFEDGFVGLASGCSVYVVVLATLGFELKAHEIESLRDLPIESRHGLDQRTDLSDRLGQLVATSQTHRFFAFRKSSASCSDLAENSFK